LPIAVLLAGLVAGCNGEDRRPPVWSYISPVIMQPNCATVSCHSRAAAVAGLDFSDPDRGYSSLTRLWVLVVDPTGVGGAYCGTVNGVVVCEKQLRPLITPYDPAQSKLIHMLRAQDASRMPPDRPLPEADIQLVERWILNGALKNQNGATDAGPADAAAATEGGAGDDAADAQADAQAQDGASNEAAAKSDGAPGDGAGSDVTAAHDGSGGG
jgi:hypothetical protein